jgi:hypothetical protein
MTCLRECWGNDANSRTADLTGGDKNDADDQPTAEEPDCKGRDKRSRWHRYCKIALSPAERKAGDESESERNQDRRYLIARVDPPSPYDAQHESARSECTSRGANPDCPRRLLIRHQSPIGLASRDLKRRTLSCASGLD